MRSFYVMLCMLALFSFGCGNSDKTTETKTDDSYSRQLGRDIGGSINDMTQSAKDAAESAQEKLDETQDIGESLE